MDNVVKRCLDNPDQQRARSVTEDIWCRRPRTSWRQWPRFARFIRCRFWEK